MRWLYKIFRTVVVTALLLGLVLPAVVYVVMSLPPVQSKLRDVAETELAKLLGVDVKIGTLDFSPFNRLILHDVLLSGERCDTIASIETLGAGVNLISLLQPDRSIIITYAEIVGLDGRVSRDTPESPLNIQPIIDALSPKDKDKPQTLFDLKINMVVIRSSALRYDVLSAPTPQPGRFDASHVAITGLRADMSLPRIANNDFRVNIESLGFRERSGLRLENLQGACHLTDTLFTAASPSITVNNSRLIFGDIRVPYKSLQTIGSDILTSPLALELLSGSRVVPSDFTPLLPPLQDLDLPLDITANISGTVDNIAVNSLVVTTPDGLLGADVAGYITDARDPSRMKASAMSLAIHCDGSRVADVAGRFVRLSRPVSSILARAGRIALSGEGSWERERTRFAGTVTADQGEIEVNATLMGKKVEGTVDTRDFDIGRLLARDDLGLASIAAQVGADFSRGLKEGSFNGDITRFDWRGYSFTAINADLVYDGHTCRGDVESKDPELDFDLHGNLALDGEIPVMDIRIDVDRLNPAVVGLASKFPNHRLSLDATANLSGKNLDDAVGELDIHSISFLDGAGEGMDLRDILVRVDNQSRPQMFTISSELIDGRIEGEYRTTKIPEHFLGIIADVFPVLVPAPANLDPEDAGTDNFTFDFVLKPNKPLEPFVKLPVDIEENINVSGAMNCAEATLSLNLLAPYLIKGGTLLQNTSLNVDIDGRADEALLYFNTDAFMKKDKINLVVMGEGGGDNLDTSIYWKYDRPKRYDGEVNLSSTFSRDMLGRVGVDLGINPGQFAVNDTVWTISPATVLIMPGPRVEVSGVEVGHEDQYVRIDGRVSDSPQSVLTVSLSDISLDYIFETLNIDNVKFGGNATGVVEGRALLSGEPQLSTSGFGVRSLAYNYCLLGDAQISSSWDNSLRAVNIRADIDQPNGCRSVVDGSIMPMTDSLDFRFDCNKIRVGFMQPIMAAFASEVDGYASGKARLWGSFKLVDMVGDIYAEDLRIKLDFTGTEYFATDSIHLYPGYIPLDNIRLSDINGHHAMLNGWLRHQYFKAPRFEFVVSDADDLLCYDKKPSGNVDDLWYGKVYADGSARVVGEPGRVDIGINVTTAPNSTFTFVISDAEVADDYTFITFRDRTVRSVDVGERLQSEKVKEFFDRARRVESSSSSDYNLDIQVDVTPDAEVVLVMDPVAGDRIRARGNGDLRLTYESASEDLRMYGTYMLDRGNYNFTLQDIIIKDFTIDSGSSITFNGDPYGALLDINAEYVVNANLSDLDESFLQDKDLNRTNVPVHALMHISGDMRQPDIDFDLSFPTLNSDVYRKVKSIVSTEDMMNRQIVYLLALNRFYTPEYMSATKGNELVSVASSTLSSQLGNALGKISDNWSIAPALRSDRGDFSDVEFDLALSSTLLNNRLLLNGNFGYRDHALNNNSFIGDFDIEYLLNRAGTWRLKAYNRYNDQNYYVRSALTTQGVGIQLRRDFDTILPRLFRRGK